MENCQNYNIGGCPFEDMKCRFLHLRTDETFKCTICDETFPSKSDFMLHRKQHHSEMVQECKNGDKCVYEKTCWYRHEKIFSQIDNNKTNSENYKNEKLFKKLEDMIVKLDVKVENIEK